ncbi:MAG TPA: sn-glycerol-3-phosphate ABC transporter ATP-binding protein UgpC [Geminicoccus sp.]|uniref:ABC transporter ATP-binding protein n=1 Tax=Geminicoccus sp. TaxID=2024832 RepID=UPI002BC3D69B|nr:sn-glycerol-3-phosphate ABC transporter ATP-binding protein UgpC [Geminicoccus sp.]HWL70036.1 sn-glycerol-3-phosphate ABC transporter ATP-binding protein UgpC [Geminicoccus sp.]
MATIEIRDIGKNYGDVRVLDGLDLDIGDGEFIVLLGPSGCGKSTMLRMIAGLEDVDSGTIAIGGTVVNDLAPGDRGVAMVFQSYALYPHMTVFDNIAFGLRRLRVPKPEIARRVDEVAKLLAIDGLLARKPAQLSGGQQQRVAMARAMIKTPSVFLFDEPLSNLDAKLRDHLRVEIKRLHGMLGTTTIFVTHDQLEAMALADRIVVMNGGRIEQQGTPQEIYHAPETLFVARFVGNPTINLLDGQVGKDGRIEYMSGSLDVGAARLDGLAPGSPLTIGIRARDLKLPGRLPEAAIAGRIDAKVELVELLGDEAQLDLLVGDKSLVVLVDGRTPPATGSTLSLEIDRNALHLFDPQSGRAVRRTSRKLHQAA